MNGHRKTYTNRTSLAVALVLGASAGTVVAGVLLPQPWASGRGDQAWSERLNGQAEADQARIDNAYTLRLLGIHQQQVNGAWTDRLHAQAEALGLRGMSDRAAQAWTDRLDGLAGVHAAK